MDQTANINAPKPASRVLAIAYVLVFLIIAGGLYYYFEIFPNQQRIWNEQQADNYLHGTTYQLAQKSFNQGDFADAITQTQAVIDQAPNNAAKQNSSFLLAMSQHGNGDLADSAKTYKSIVANSQGLDPSYQAFALDALGFMTDLFEDNPQADREYVFNDPPYSDYLQQANGNVFLADITLFKRADSLFSTAQSKYEIAYKEARLLYAETHSNSGMSTSSDDAAMLATNIQTNIHAGDALIGGPMLAYALQFAPAMWPQLYLFRAFALDQSNVITQNISDASINGAYEQALDLAATSTDAQMQTMDANIRFFYAASLNRRLPAGPDKTKQIQSLLSYFGSIDQTGKGSLSSASFLKYISLDDPAQNPLTSQIGALAAMSPEFKSFLKAENIAF